MHQPQTSLSNPSLCSSSHLPGVYNTLMPPTALPQALSKWVLFPLLSSVYLFQLHSRPLMEEKLGSMVIVYRYVHSNSSVVSVLKQLLHCPNVLHAMSLDLTWLTWATEGHICILHFSKWDSNFSDTLHENKNFINIFVILLSTLNQTVETVKD